MHPNSRRYFAAKRAKLKATDAQELYYKRLLAQCSTLRITVGYDVGKAKASFGQRLVTKTEVSKEIDYLKGLIAAHKTKEVAHETPS